MHRPKPGLCSLLFEAYAPCRGTSAAAYVCIIAYKFPRYLSTGGLIQREKTLSAPIRLANSVPVRADPPGESYRFAVYINLHPFRRKFVYITILHVQVIKYACTELTPSLALWIASHTGINGRAAFDEWIAVSDGKGRLVYIACPVGTNFLTELGAVAWAVVAGSGNRFVAREFSVHGAVEGVPGVH